MRQRRIGNQAPQRRSNDLLAALLLLLTLTGQACQASQPTTVQEAADDSTPVPAGSGFQLMNQEDEGARLYFRNCAGCHGTNGEGAAGAYPPLAGSGLVNGPYGPMLMPVVYGRGAMPGFSGLLEDEELAKVSSYIRAQWGNQGDMVSATQISRFRLKEAEVPLDPFGGSGNNAGGLTGD
jgi:mono/diheme cytochrome c family protein